MRYLGICEAGPVSIRRAHAVHPVTALQSEWSLWTRGIEPDIVPACRELGIGIVPFAPLGRGFLTGTVTSATQLGHHDMRRHLPRFAAGNLDRNLAIVERLKTLAQNNGVTPGQLALAWVQHKGHDVVPIPGTRRRTYLEQNTAAATLQLPAQDIAALDALAATVAGDRYPPAMAKNTVE